MQRMLLECIEAERFSGVTALCGTEALARGMEAVVPPANVHVGFDEATVEQTLARGEALLAQHQAEGGPHQPPLLILDDIAAHDPQAVNGDLMRRVLGQGRHMGVCVWVLAQAWRQINAHTHDQYTDIVLANETSIGILVLLQRVLGILPDTPPSRLQRLVAQTTRNHGMLVVQPHARGAPLYTYHRRAAGAQVQDQAQAQPQAQAQTDEASYGAAAMEME